MICHNDLLRTMNMSIKLPNFDNLIVWKIHWNTCCVRCMSMLSWKLNFTESPKVMIINTFCTVTVPRQFCGLVNLTFDQSYIVQCFLTSLHLYFPGDFWNCELVCKLQKLHMHNRCSSGPTLRLRLCTPHQNNEDDDSGVD